MASSPEQRDYEESFEDAPELKINDEQTLPRSNSTRSLTGRRQSNGSATTPRATEHPPLPSPLGDDQKDDSDDAGSPTALSPESETEHTPKKKAKSPLLTAHRLSTTSLDDVNLNGNKDDDSEQESPVPESKPTSPPPPSGDSTSNQRSSIPPSISSGSIAANKSPPPAAQPAPPTRKLTSPFSWLSRNSSGGKDNKSPPQATGYNRRNTGASVSTVGSSSELHDADNASISSRKTGRSSLRDQFRILRMREEGVPDNDQLSLTSGRGSISHGSPSSIPEEQEDGVLVSPPTTASVPPPASPLPSTANPDLPPGTVSGITAAASDVSAPVDWELWQQVVNNGPEALHGTNADELNAAIKRGIPQTIRGVIWQVLADSRNPELEEVYRTLVARGTDKEKHMSVSSTVNGSVNDTPVDSSRSSIRSEVSVTQSNTGTSSPSPSQEKDAERLAKEQAATEAARKKKAKEDAAALQKLEKAIRRDLGSRTSYSKYFLSQGSQEALFGLCKAYALYDEEVGYAQGVNFIAMPLLFNMDEGEAFTLLVKLMHKYGLRQMFINEMPGLHLHLYQFERLLEDLEPALYCHLRRRGVTPQLYATQWFLTLFAYRFPLQLVLRIYDLIFEEGLESTILRFGIAIMQRNAKALLEMKDMSALSTFLKERLFDVYIDQQPSASSILESGFFGSSGGDKEIYRADVMVQDACAVPLTPQMIKSYTQEWDEKVRTEKEREEELQNLRHTATSQAARIRILEEHAERSDKEHVQLASELVRVKVENEELQDANESLRVQVDELKKVVDKQPAEVEEKLRTEMERIMKRNIEVQNENRSMEEQMAEMEKDLVETKMKWAELSEQHDSLKQKWSDLRRALD
ncbi:GTPase activating protein [Paecilomyces variotii No. 5]|uniref:GTPase-activating protein GYP5 n=1 Tax=Byssochlamys spectabilis (strain No. 5 / NBRC 109023) TaxID=1356009 RepID=V5GCJ2_BYSSN|nr:GTPase activating protein [Paecilomyces variotii No. 5]